MKTVRLIALSLLATPFEMSCAALVPATPTKPATGASDQRVHQPEHSRRPERVQIDMTGERLLLNGEPIEMSEDLGTVPALWEKVKDWSVDERSGAYEPDWKPFDLLISSTTPSLAVERVLATMLHAAMPRVHFVGTGGGDLQLAAKPPYSTSRSRFTVVRTGPNGVEMERHSVAGPDAKGEVKKFMTPPGPGAVQRAAKLLRDNVRSETNCEPLVICGPRTEPIATLLELVHAARTSCSEGEWITVGMWFRDAECPPDRLGNPGLIGTLPPDRIQALVRRNYATFRTCYEAGLKRNRGLKGRVSTRFRIEEDGRVSHVSHADSTLLDTDVVRCVADGFGSLRFDRPWGGVVTVVYPIEFSPGD